MRLSRGFLCASFGIAMTLFSWYSPWAWPAWPALTTMRLLVGTQASFADLPFGVRGAVVVLLIVINVAVWAGAAMLVWTLVGQWRTVRRRPPPPI
ncbi:MAG TPA: hypothetical protein VII12_11355 [Thermoanaerobaculia bacterium]